MSALFQGTCKNCKYTTSMMGSRYGAVFVDQPAPDDPDEERVVNFSRDGIRVALVDDPRFDVIPHPLGAEMLDETEYTRSDLFWQGRYVDATNVICRDCGTIFPHRRLASPGNLGCKTTLCLSIASGIAVGIWKRSFLAGFAAWYAVLLGVSCIIDLLASAYVRIRFSERAASLKSERLCPTCHANNAVPVWRARSIMCPACRTRALRFMFAGRT